MRILFVYIGFLPAEHWGGPVKIIYQNAKELLRRGHDVAVCASDLLNKKERMPRGLRHQDIDGIRVSYIPTYNIPVWPGSVGPTFVGPDALEQIRHEISRAEIVHLNGLRTALVSQAASTALSLHKPLVLQPHGTLQRIGRSHNVKWLYDHMIVRRYLSQVDSLIAAQKAEKEQIIRAGGKPSRIRIVPNGYACNPIDSVGPGMFRRKLGIGSKKRIILFLGRINWKKGTDLLVKAYAHLPPEVRDLTALIVAGPDDGQLREIQELIRELQLGHQVVLPGLLTGPDVQAALADADVFVLPCRTDTFPMAIVEACCAGLPQVVTDTCEIASVIAGKSATVVPVDISAIAGAILDLLQNEDLRAIYRAGGHELMNSVFSIEAVGAALEDVYAHAIESNRERYGRNGCPPHSLEDH